MATLYADAFTRADDVTNVGSPTTGGPYTERVGTTWGIISNQLYTSASLADSVITVPTAADVDFSATVSGTDTSLGIIHHWIDSNNFLLLQHNAGVANFHQKAGGTFYQRSLSFTAAMPCVLRMVVVGRLVMCYAGGTLFYTGEDQGATLPGVSGFRCSANTGGRFDDALAIDATPLSVLDSAVIGDADLQDSQADALDRAAWAHRGRDTYAFDLAGVV